MLDCNIVVSEFELQSHYYMHFLTNSLRKGMNLLIPPAIGSIVPLPFFYKDCFDIKLPTKVDMLLNKETKLNQKQNCMELGFIRMKSAAHAQICVSPKTADKNV